MITEMERALETVSQKLKAMALMTTEMERALEVDDQKLKALAGKDHGPFKPDLFSSDEARLALVFDTETTGLVQNMTVQLDKQPHVIEFCGMIVDLADGRMIEEVNTLVRPPVKLWTKIVNITGLTDEVLEKERGWQTVFPDIVDIIEKAPLVIAHNLTFDKDMVDIEMRRLGKQVAWPRGVCTVEATEHYRGRRLTMERLHEYLFGCGFPKAHRARNDVLALVRIAVELNKRGDI